MSSKPQPQPGSMRSLIHELNGEIFLLRGYADLTRELVHEQPAALKNLEKMVERLDAVERISDSFRQKQMEYEPAH